MVEVAAPEPLETLLARAGGLQAHVDRLTWLEELAHWIHGVGFAPSGDEARNERLNLLLAVLEADQGVRERFAALLGGVVRELRGTRLFADVGVPVEPGFWREAIDRIARTHLPHPPLPRSFAEFVHRLFPDESDAHWLERSPHAAWERLWLLMESTETPLSGAWSNLSMSMKDAVRILAVRIAALGVAQDIRDRLPELAVSELPFLHLPRVCDTIEPGAPNEASSNAAVLDAIDACRATLELVHVHVEEFGVSVDSVYRLELIDAQLARLEQLVSLLFPRPDTLAANLGRLGLALVRAQFQGRSVLDLLRTSSHLLARKIVERTGKTGEHYITRTRAEWREMFVSAAGGGVLTAFTAAIKLLTGSMALPVFFVGLTASANYSVSFLLMAALGFTLATKQPSMTAAALAASLESSEDEGAAHIEPLVTLIAQISRSQLAAAIGNVGLVIPTALAIDFVWRRATGHHLLTPAKARYVVESLHPSRSGTIFHAAVTGVLLWMSSLGAGWLENWVTYNKLPDAMAASRRLRRVFGAARVERLARLVEEGAASFGGSVSLGVLLGTVPLLGVVFGLPVDVRHVTLSTGSLVFAGSVLGPAVVKGQGYLFAVGGIAIIGALNFGVSFALALAVAIRARNAWRTDSGDVGRRLVRALLRRLIRSPLQFVYAGRPSRDPEGGAAV